MFTLEVSLSLNNYFNCNSIMNGKLSGLQLKYGRFRVLQSWCVKLLLTLLKLDLNQINLDSVCLSNITLKIARHTIGAKGYYFLASNKKISYRGYKERSFS